MEDEVLDTICNLTCFESLAVGHLSQVFRGELVYIKSHEKLPVAAKRVRYESMRKDEIAALKQLKHKNIIKFYGTYVHSETRTYIIMELADNGDLYHFLMKYRHSQEEKNQEPRLELEIVWKWVLEAASAIQYLHSKFTNHRDINSQHYLVMGNFILKLGDLGLAKKMESTQDTKGCGKCRWMAPEVIKDNRRSSKSDVFSFGIVTWEIFSTDVPYCDRRNEFKVMSAVHSGERPTIPEDCPKYLARLMQNCWEADYNKRPNMDSIVSELVPYQSDVDISRLTVKMTDMQLKSVSLPPDGKDFGPIKPEHQGNTSFEEVLSDKYLLDTLANKLGKDWESLAIYLNFGKVELYRIRTDCSDVLTATHQMLITWRQKQDPQHGLKQVIENLSEALRSCNRTDLAHKVRRLLDEQALSSHEKS